MAMEIKRSEDEVWELLNKVGEKINEGGSKYRGMTYEQGIEAAIMWVTGDWEDHPYDD